MDTVASNSLFKTAPPSRWLRREFKLGIKMAWKISNPFLNVNYPYKTDTYLAQKTSWKYGEKSFAQLALILSR